MSPPILPPAFDQCDTGATNPVADEIRRHQGALLIKLIGVIVPLVIGGAVTVYLQTDRNHQELMRQAERVAEHETATGHEGTRQQLGEIVAEVRALRQEMAGGRAVQDQRWAEVNRRLDALERRRNWRGGSTASR